MFARNSCSWTSDTPRWKNFVFDFIFGRFFVVSVQQNSVCVTKASWEIDVVLQNFSFPREKTVASVCERFLTSQSFFRPSIHTFWLAKLFGNVIDNEKCEKTDSQRLKQTPQVPFSFFSPFSAGCTSLALFLSLFCLNNAIRFLHFKFNLKQKNRNILMPTKFLFCNTTRCEFKIPCCLIQAALLLVEHRSQQGSAWHSIHKKSRGNVYVFIRRLSLSCTSSLTSTLVHVAFDARCASACFAVDADESRID